MAHKEALVRSLSQIQINTSTSPKELVHMVTIDQATCIVFLDIHFPLEVHITLDHFILQLVI